jgi:type VI secretion system secreted protein Hcp
MAYEFYVTIEGMKQGKFKGESPRDKHKDKTSGLSFNHEIKSPRDLATGQASGKRQHGPITFTKEWGASSPQLFQALVTNEVLKSALFEFVHTTKVGEEEVYYTIKLVNATVSNIKYMTGKDSGESSGTAKHSAAYDTHELEEVSLTYQRIEVEHKVGKTMAQDDWHL